MSERNVTKLAMKQYFLWVADLAEMLPPKTFILARRCCHRFTSSRAALSFKMLNYFNMMFIAYRPCGSFRYSLVC